MTAMYSSVILWLIITHFDICEKQGRLSKHQDVMTTNRKFSVRTLQKYEQNMCSQWQECHGPEQSKAEPLMYEMCARCLSVSTHPCRSVFSPSSALLSHSGPQMTGGLSSLPPTITSVWESLATEGQTLSIKMLRRTGRWAPQWFLWGWTWHMLDMFWYPDFSLRL